MAVELTDDDFARATVMQRITAIEVAVQALCTTLEDVSPGFSARTRAKVEEAFLRAEPAAAAHIETRGLTHKLVTSLLQVRSGIPDLSDGR